MAKKVHDSKRRVFWCNTNRGAVVGGDSLEHRMHEKGFAAVWTWEGHQHETFNYTEHTNRAGRGHMIFMYANGHGVIGVGQARDRREVLSKTQRGRLRDFKTEGENQEEWRIPVTWRAWWDDKNPFIVNPPLRGTFLEITHHVDLVDEVLKHFRL